MREIQKDSLLVTEVENGYRVNVYGGILEQEDGIEKEYVFNSLEELTGFIGKKRRSGARKVDLSELMKAATCSSAARIEDQLDKANLAFDVMPESDYSCYQDVSAINSNSLVCSASQITPAQMIITLTDELKTMPTKEELNHTIAEITVEVSRFMHGFASSGDKKNG